MLRSRLIKCTLFWLALMAFMGCLTVSASAEVAAQQAYTSDTPLLYAVRSDGVWLYKQNMLMWYGNDDREPQTIIQRKDIVRIASGLESSELYYLTEAADGTHFLHAVTPGGTVALDAVPLESRVCDIAQSGGLWALDESGRVCSVYTGDGSLNVLSIAGWDNSGVTAFAIYQNQLLAYQASSGDLALLDLHTHTVVATVNVPALCDVQIGRLKEGVPTALALRETDAGRELVMIRMRSGECETLDTNLPADCAGLKRNEQTLYTLGNAGTMLFALSLRELYGESDKPTLTIVNDRSGYYHLPVAIEMFHQRYPDVEVILREINDARVVATEMMAGSGDIDLVCIQDSMMPISAAILLRVGALLDLNQFEELTALKAHYQDIFGMVTISGHWYAAPTDSMDICFWRVNPHLAEALGWEPPEERWTWEDFRALAERVKAYNETAEKPMYLLQDDAYMLPCFLMEYQANHIDAYAGVADYTSDTYLDLLRLWKELSDSGLIYAPPKTHNSTMGSNVLLYSERTPRMAMASNPYILPPTETADSLYPVYMCALALNANSPHLEEAVYFLSCYLSVEAVSNLFYFDTGRWLKGAERIENDIVNVSDENDALWNYVLEHSAPELYLYDISRQQCDTLLPGLLDGTVTPEQFAQISQQLADMMLGE